MFYKIFQVNNIKIYLFFYLMGNGICPKCYHSKNCEQESQVIYQPDWKRYKYQNSSFEKTPNGQRSGKNGNGNRKKGPQDQRGRERYETSKTPNGQRSGKNGNGNKKRGPQDPKGKRPNKTPKKQQQPQYRSNSRPKGVKKGNQKLKQISSQEANHIRYIIKGENNVKQKYYIIRMQDNNNSAVDQDQSHRQDPRDLASHQSDDDIYYLDLSLISHINGDESVGSEPQRRNNGNGERHYEQSEVNIITNLSNQQHSVSEEERNDTDESIVSVSRNQLMGLMYRMYREGALSRE